MKTTTRYTTMMLTLALLLMLGGCVKDELHDTPHPGKAKLTVTADWSRRGPGIAVPVSWSVSMSSGTTSAPVYSGTETGETHAPDYLFTPGNYRLVAWNPAENITVEGTTATAATASDGTVHPTPGWFFTSVQDVTIEADQVYDFTAVMRQQVRELTIQIAPTGDAAGRIVSIEGYLGGAAGTLDFATGTHGTPSNVELLFTKITEGDNAGKWTTTVRLLGIAGDTQRLTVTLTYSDDNPQPTSLESDLTAALDGFNDGKTTPLTLGGTVAETPAEAGVTATIDDWQTVTGDPVEAI